MLLLQESELSQSGIHPRTAPLALGASNKDDQHNYKQYTYYRGRNADHVLGRARLRGERQPARYEQDEERHLEPDTADVGADHWVYTPWRKRGLKTSSIARMIHTSAICNVTMAAIGVMTPQAAVAL